VENVKKFSIQYIYKMFARIIDFITIDIWRIRLEDLPLGKSFIIKQLRIFILTMRGFDEDKCFLRASSLTFYTLLSIVPVVALLFGIAKGFGFEKILKKNLIERFPGQPEVLTKVIEFAESLLEVTKGGLIAGIGLIILFWSVIKVLSNIEASLNDIWEIKTHRTWSRKFSDYLAVMLISPLLILMSSSTTVFITTQVTEITNNFRVLGFISPLIFFGLKLIPYVIIWILFTGIYVFMPNTKVSLKAAIIGGVIAGTIYQFSQILYLAFQIGVSRYNAIYGSFAALPLFLVWVQISWWIVLFGAELSFANQNVDTYHYEPDSLKVSPAFKKLLTLQVAHLLIQNFSKGEIPLTDAQISKRLEIPIRLIHQILFDLVESGLFVETRTTEEQKFGYQPARDIKGITIQSLLETIENDGVDNIPVAETEGFRVLSDALKQFNLALENSPANRLLKDI
jgi:membrane protein